MEVFNEQFIKNQEKKLLSEQKQVKEELSKLTTGPKRKGIFRFLWPEIGRDISESEQEVSAYEENIVLSRNLEEILKDIEEALDRIKNGVYGICTIDGKPIEKERLEAIPTAKTHASDANQK